MRNIFTICILSLLPAIGMSASRVETDATRGCHAVLRDSVSMHNDRVVMPSDRAGIPTGDVVMPTDSVEAPTAGENTQPSAVKTQKTSRLKALLNRMQAEGTDSIWTDSVTGDRRHLQRLPAGDTLVVMRPRPFLALAEDLSVDALILGYDYFVYNREYARITKNVIKDHFRHGFVWDNDSFSGNQFSHPYHGAMCYNAARENGLSYGVSLIYPVIGSAAWEMLCETNAPAINDLLSTGIGGAAVGEVLHRTSDIFFDDSKTGVDRVVREIIGTALNPVRAAQRLFTGEMWRVSKYRGKRIPASPYTFNVTIGRRVLFENSNAEKNAIGLPYIKFDFNYGERFTKNGKTRPFDFFKLSLLANLSDHNPSVGDMNIVGRIADKQIETKNGWNLDIGFYQTVKYVDHYGKHSQFTRNFPIISEAVSFGCGVYSEHKGRRGMVSNDMILNAVVLGATNSDYDKHYPEQYMHTRRYNFGSGLSLRNTFDYTIYKRLSMGDDLYLMQLFTPSSDSPEERQAQIERCEEINTMGDRGSNSIVMNTAYVALNVSKFFKINVGFSVYWRRSVYTYLPAVTGFSQACNVGLVYSL